MRKSIVVMALALTALFLSWPLLAQQLITDLELVQIEPTKAHFIFTTPVEGTTALYWGVYGTALKYQDFGGGNVKIHSFFLDDLTPNTFYECFAASVLVTGQNVWSKKMSFKTPFVGPVIISAGEAPVEQPLPVPAGRENLKVLSVQFETHDTLARYFLKEIQFQLEPVLMRAYLKSVQLTNENNSWSVGGGGFNQLGRYNLTGLTVPLNDANVKNKLFLVINLAPNAPTGLQFRCQTFGDWLRAVDTSQLSARVEGAAIGNYFVVTAATGVKIFAETFLSLAQNYPNPFNPATAIEFFLPSPQKISLRVFDAFGREVAVLIKNEFYPAGGQKLIFDGTALSSGVYFYHLRSATSVLQRSMILLK